MSMKINDISNNHYDGHRVEHMERLKAQQERQAEKEQDKEEKKEPAKTQPMRRDEYIPGEGYGAADKEDEAKQPQTAPESPGSPKKPEEKWMGNTDKVDREIEKLKEKKKEQEQQIRAASGDEQKARALDKELAQVENELRQKDNDAYRKQHSSMHKIS